MQDLTPAIRYAVLDDIPALLELERLFPTDRMDRRSFRHLLQTGHGKVLVCEIGTQLVGAVVVLYRRNSRTARMYSLVVDPAHRGRGIAAALMRAVEVDARAHGSEHLRLEVRPDNETALRLYAREGFQQEGRLEAFYEDGSPALRFGKSL